MKPSDMTGRVALVTGGAKGLGAATALCLARAGADIALVDIDGAGLADTAQRIEALGRQVLVLERDLSSRENCSLAVSGTVERFGRLDALCNIAAVLSPGQTIGISDEQWDLALAVNLSAPFFLIREALPHLLEAHGAIVNVTSCAAFRGQAYFAAYCATKAGLTHMTKALAMEFTHAPIRINAVAPGGMLTAITQQMSTLADCDPRLLSRLPAPRGLCEVEDVADCVAFLASDAARSFHGACINVDAGATAD